MQRQFRGYLSEGSNSKLPFKFPPPPSQHVPRWSPSSSSDTSGSSVAVPRPRTRNKFRRKSHRGYASEGDATTRLPPIGVFWDIENCQIPHGKSALTIVQAIRDEFFEEFWEAQFLVVCDVTKQNRSIMNELTAAQVTVTHVCSTSKNAADDKLRQEMRRFADNHKSGAVILISSDINFSPDLCDLRNRRKMYVILLHMDMCSESLIFCANEHYDFGVFTSTLPLRAVSQLEDSKGAEILVSNLPQHFDPKKVRTRLKILSQNCGGRVAFVNGVSATIRFSSLDSAVKGLKRLDGESVFGNKIKVLCLEMIRANHDFYGSCNGSGEMRARIKQLSESQESRSDQSDAVNPSKYENGGPSHMSHDISMDLLFGPKSGNENGSMPLPEENSYSDHLVSELRRGQNRVPLKCSKVSILTPPQAAGKYVTPSSPLFSRQSQRNGPKTDLTFDSAPDKTCGFNLYITNLDQNLSPEDMKRLLWSLFEKHVTVLNVSVFMHPDNYYVATVTVCSYLDARYAISNLHRRNVGHRKIVISHSNQKNVQLLKWQIISLLREVPNYQLHLIKFIDLFESHYAAPVTHSDLFKLKDVCNIFEDATGKYIALNETHQVGPLSSFQGFVPYCVKHAERVYKSSDDGLPKVTVGIRKFAKNLKELLKSHNNSLSILSLIDCYNAECMQLSLSEDGVPLEHLVTWVDSVVLEDVNGVKFVKLSPEDHSVGEVGDDRHPWLVNSEVELEKEVLDMLKAQPLCQLLFSKFIPTFHHFHGKQCRVADYGFTKLIDLLESLSSIQVVGTGNSRTVILSHATQLQRFSADFLKLIQAQPNETLFRSQFLNEFKTMFGRPFNPIEYGLCSLSDLFSYVADTCFIAATVGNETVLTTPRLKPEDQNKSTDEFCNYDQLSPPESSYAKIECQVNLKTAVSQLPDQRSSSLDLLDVCAPDPSEVPLPLWSSSPNEVVNSRGISEQRLTFSSSGSSKRKPLAPLFDLPLKKLF